MVYSIGASLIFILTVAALVDCWGTDVRIRAKAVWTLGILAFPLLGSVVWFAFGQAWRKPRPAPAPEPERPVSRDDATGEPAPQPA